MNKFLTKTHLKNIAIALVIAIFFVADIFLKAISLDLMSSSPRELIGNIFSFHPTANYYMAFSFPFSGSLLNTAVSLIIVALILYILHLKINKKEKKSEVILLIFILLGALSNLADRWTHGYVIDYLELKYFTVFNIADVMISGGALLLIWKNIKNK
jgi:signal peptidase II